MTTVSVTSKGQVTIPRQVKKALGITSGSRVEFILERGGARLKLATEKVPSSVEEGASILSYAGPRISLQQMRGGMTRKKVGKSARP